jgi:hypothetical protein
MLHSRYLRVFIIGGVIITLIFFIIIFFKQSKGRSHLDVGAGVFSPALRGYPTGVPLQNSIHNEIVRETKDEPKKMIESTRSKNIPLVKKEIKKSLHDDSKSHTSIEVPKDSKSVEDLLADFSYHVDFQKTGRNIRKVAPSKDKIKENAQKNKINMVDVKINFDSAPREKQTQEDVKTVLDKKVEGIKACLNRYYSEKTTKVNKIGIHFSLEPSGSISDIYFDNARLIGKSMRSCMQGVLDKKVGPVKKLEKPLGIHYVYTIKTNSKIDFSK